MQTSTGICSKLMSSRATFNAATNSASVVERLTPPCFFNVHDTALLLRSTNAPVSDLRSALSAAKLDVSFDPQRVETHSSRRHSNLSAAVPLMYCAMRLKSFLSAQ
uniref:Uncharacterized protein n=1 Tax=Peronospora matthiolae TaxID=2874970 RepID=A0AAV1UUF2_9STRA